jgi:hypothetical protein
MIPQSRHWRSSNAEGAWLRALIDTMGEVSRAELRAAPRDATLLKAVHAHLTRPSSPRGPYGSNFSFRN